jgi:hypothetical protein
LMLTVHGFWSVNMWLCFFILLIYCKFVQHMIMKHLSMSILSGTLYWLGQIRDGNLKKFIRPKAHKGEVLCDNICNTLLHCAVSLLKSLL